MSKGFAVASSTLFTLHLPQSSYSLQNPNFLHHQHYHGVHLNRPRSRPSCPRAQNSANEEAATKIPTSTTEEAQTNAGETQNPAANNKRTRQTRAESTDWIASSLTRRFGLAGGLAWFAFLAFGVISEQVKTRLEVFQETQNTRDLGENAEEVQLPNGIKYVDMRLGGGPSPRAGDLVLIKLQGKVQSSGSIFVETQRPVAFLLGVKPYSAGICDGLVEIIRTMKTGGVRKAVIPADLAFGHGGAVFEQSSAAVPPDSAVEYEVELQKTSIPP